MPILPPPPHLDSCGKNEPFFFHPSRALSGANSTVGPKKYNSRGDTGFRSQAGSWAWTHSRALRGSVTKSKSRHFPRLYLV